MPSSSPPSAPCRGGRGRSRRRRTSSCSPTRRPSWAAAALQRRCRRRGVSGARRSGSRSTTGPAPAPSSSGRWPASRTEPCSAPPPSRWPASRPEADGSQRATLPLSGDPGRPVSTPGVYPVEIEVLDGRGRRLDDLVTDLVVLPEAADATPPLAVAVVAEPGDRPGGAARPRRRAVAEALTAVPDVPATPRGGARPARGRGHLHPTGRRSARGRPAGRRRRTPGPRPPVRPRRARRPRRCRDRRTSLRHQRTAGTAIVEGTLGVRAGEHTWLAGPGLGTEGLRILSALGVRRALLADRRRTRTDGVLSPARPFERWPRRQVPSARRPRRADRRPPHRPGARERRRGDRRTGPGRGPHGGRPRPAVVRAARGAAGRRRPGGRRRRRPDGAPGARGAPLVCLFRAVGLDDRVRRRRPVRGRVRDPPRRSLLPDDARDITTATADDVRGRCGRYGQACRAWSATGLLTWPRSTVTCCGRPQAGLPPPPAVASSAEAQSAVDGLAEAVSSPDEFTITLTAREGTVPLTIRNDTGGPDAGPAPVPPRQARPP